MLKGVICLLSLLAFAAAALPELGVCNLEAVFDEIRTGDVLERTFVIEEGFSGTDLDGVNAQQITINGGIPGPELHVNLGDTVRITVVNNLLAPFSLHFHGQTFFEQPWMDGDDQVSNCATLPTRNFTYEWVAHPEGTHFYHAHKGFQRTFGAYGVFVVHDTPVAEETDHAIIVSDWHHQYPGDDYQHWTENIRITCGTTAPHYNGFASLDKVHFPFGSLEGNGIMFTSFLVNGKGVYNWAGTQIPFVEPDCPGMHAEPPACSSCVSLNDVAVSTPCSNSSADSLCGSVSFIEAAAGTSNRLRFINSGQLFSTQVCIDGHMLTIVAADGLAVEPYEVECFIMSPAERFDVLVQTDKPTGDYPIRFTTVESQTAGEFFMGGPNNNNPNLPNYGYAILRYGLVPIGPVAIGEPPACDATFTTNCGPAYWLNATTIGCSPSVLPYTPYCRSILELKGGNFSDAKICAEKGLSMPHEVEANTRLTIALSFFEPPPPIIFPPRPTKTARMEYFFEEEYGYPFNTPADLSGVRNPVSFQQPPYPLQALSISQRETIYNLRETWLPPQPTFGFPEGFVQGVSGTNGIFFQYGDVVQFFMNCTSPFGVGCGRNHPFHLHGHHFAVLYSGDYLEPFNSSKFNYENPVYKDTFNVHSTGWYVVQFAATNPGAWRFHCHFTAHLTGGMSMIFDTYGDESVESVRRTPNTPKDNNCFIPPDPPCDDDSSAASLGVPFVLLILSFWRAFW